MLKKYLETGKIVGTHGVKGMVRVQPWCDSSDFLCKFKTLYTDSLGNNSIKVISAKPHGNIVIMSIKGVDSIDKAEALRNKVIYINRDDVTLPRGRYFIDDLVGCNVYDNDTNAHLGKISEVSATGANDVWHIVKDNKEYLVPAIDEVIVSVEPEIEKIVLKPIKGIFEDED